MTRSRGSSQTANNGTVSRSGRLISTVLISVMALAGCMDDSSAGSSSGDGGPLNTACGEGEVLNIQEDEASRASLDMPACFEGNHTDIEVGKHLSEVTYAHGRLTFSITEVDRPSRSTVEFLDSAGRALLTVNVAVRNLSGQAIERKAEHLTRQRDEILSLQQDRRLFHYLLDVAYLNERISWREKQIRMNAWTPETTDHFDALKGHIERVEAVLDQYRSGEAGERELGRASDRATRALPSHGQYAGDQLRELARDLDTPVPDVDGGTLTYRSNSEQVSRHIGNRSYGQYTAEGDWQFDSRFEFIHDVVQQERES